MKKTIAAEGSVTIEVMGGLGNQLFQYALGVAIAKRQGLAVHLDPGWFQVHGDRSLLLPRIDPDLNMVVSNYPELIAKARLSTAMRFPATFETVFTKTLVDRQAGYDKRVLESVSGMRLIGYFQSPRYFENVTDQVRASVLSASAGKSPENNYESSTTNRSPVIALHVRMGDYASARQGAYHGQLSADYYQRALAHIRFLANDALIRVFSDGIPSLQFIKEAVGSSVFEIVPRVDDESPLTLLCNMASADAIICANSTFSWWAAFLGDRVGRPVIVPGNWNRARPDLAKDLFPPHWTVL